MARLSTSEVSGQLDVDAAREVADVEEDVLCLGAISVLPVLRALAPKLVEIGQDALPWFVRWLLGGLVEPIVEGLIEALEEWRASTCTGKDS